jgi:two-component system chemotaxis response regulator CheY
MAARVLVLDDQKYLRDIIAAILEDVGYPALPVATPEEAFQQMHQHRPQLLVLDMSLAGMSGLEFLDQVRANPAWRTLPVIMVSGDPGKLVAVQDRPHVIALTKPFDANALLAAAAQLVGPPALTPSA